MPKEHGLGADHVPGAVPNVFRCIALSAGSCSTRLCFTRRETEAQKVSVICQLHSQREAVWMENPVFANQGLFHNTITSPWGGVWGPNELVEDTMLENKAGHENACAGCSQSSRKTNKNTQKADRREPITMLTKHSSETRISRFI